jgi:hypothetical protein
MIPRWVDRAHGGEMGMGYETISILFYSLFSFSPTLVSGMVFGRRMRGKEFDSLYLITYTYSS